MTTEQRRYQTPDAARGAVTDKLRAAATTSAWRLGELQRQYAYDQLVERLYRVDDAWVIKGATALLARRISVRHTVDIDVYRAGAIAEVERQAREAAALDIGDWMRFEAGPAVKITTHGSQAARMRIRSIVGVKLWAAFQVDIVADGVVMTGSPEHASPSRRSTSSTGRERPGRSTRWSITSPTRSARSSSTTAATPPPASRTSSRPGRHQSPRNRRSRTPEAGPGRGSSTPNPRAAGGLPRSRPRHRERGYRAEAQRTVGFDAGNLDTALTTVQPFLDPPLDGTATGSWNPGTRAWA